MSNYICGGKCLEQFDYIIEQDHDHEGHQQRKTREMDHALFLWRNSPAAHSLHKQEQQPASVSAGIGSRFITPRFADRSVPKFIRLSTTASTPAGAAVRYTSSANRCHPDRTGHIPESHLSGHEHTRLSTV